MIGELSESQVRVAELESARELDNERIQVFGQSHSDTIVVLEGQNAKLSQPAPRYAERAGDEDRRAIG